jgi:hypothetical protein
LALCADNGGAHARAGRPAPSLYAEPLHAFPQALARHAARRLPDLPGLVRERAPALGTLPLAQEFLEPLQGRRRLGRVRRGRDVFGGEQRGSDGAALRQQARALDPAEEKRNP